jgi:hypothetical protein
MLGVLVPLSGTTSATLLAQTPGEPAWLSGGAFGPEASLLIIPVLLAALAAMRWWTSQESL